MEPTEVFRAGGGGLPNNTVILYLFCIGLPPTNGNRGYCTLAFVSGSGTDAPNGTQVPSLNCSTARLLGRKIYESRDLDIRLSLSSTRSPGILVLNLCFKVTNYAKSWFYGHSWAVLPITPAPRRLQRRGCGRVSMAVHTEACGPTPPPHLQRRGADSRALPSALRCKG